MNSHCMTRPTTPLPRPPLLIPGQCEDVHLSICIQVHCRCVSHTAAIPGIYRNKTSHTHTYTHTHTHTHTTPPTGYQYHGDGIFLSLCSTDIWRSWYLGGRGRGRRYRTSDDHGGSTWGRTQEDICGFISVEVGKAGHSPVSGFQTNVVRDTRELQCHDTLH